MQKGYQRFLKNRKNIENKNLIKSYFFNCFSVPPKQILGQLKYFPVLGYDFQANFCDNNDDKIEAFQSKIQFNPLSMNISTDYRLALNFLKM